MWKQLNGYESIYEISADGDVRRRKGFWCRSDRLLKPELSNTGYLRVRLTNRTRQGVKRSVHRLVFEHFVGPIPEGKTVNHINGCKTDNRATNLELLSMSEQMLHAYRTGLQPYAKGEARKNVAKLTEADVRAIRAAYRFRVVTTVHLGKQYGVTKDCIGAIIRREHWAHVE